MTKYTLSYDYLKGGCYYDTIPYISKTCMKLYFPVNDKRLMLKMYKYLIFDLEIDDEIIIMACKNNMLKLLLKCYFSKTEPKLCFDQLFNKNYVESHLLNEVLVTKIGLNQCVNCLKITKKHCYCGIKFCSKKCLSESRHHKTVIHIKRENVLKTLCKIFLKDISLLIICY